MEIQPARNGVVIVPGMHTKQHAAPRSAPAQRRRQQGTPAAERQPSRASAQAGETLAERLHLSPRMAAQRQRFTGLGEPVQLNAEQIKMDEEFARLRADFDQLHDDFDIKKKELDDLLIKVAQVHLNHRYYQNRWENYRVEWSRFFSFDPQSLLGEEAHVRGKTALRKFQRKMTWYRRSGEGLALLHSTYKEFKPILEEQAAAVDHKDAIDARMEIYKEMLDGEDDGREVAAIAPERVSNINAVKNDPKRKPDLSLTQIEDSGPGIATGEERQRARMYLLQKGDIPQVWEPYLAGEGAAPFGIKAPKFRNLFGEDTVLMGDNYRPPWHKYFASDAFFSQWLAAIQAAGKSDELPTKFPSTFYRNNIDNAATNAVIQKILPGEADGLVVMRPSHEHWAELLESPNGKSTLNIVQEYNMINKARGQDAYRIKSIQVYRKLAANCLKFEMGV